MRSLFIGRVRSSAGSLALVVAPGCSLHYEGERRVVDVLFVRPAFPCIFLPTFVRPQAERGLWWGLLMRLSLRSPVVTVSQHRSGFWQRAAWALVPSLGAFILIPMVSLVLVGFGADRAKAQENLATDEASHWPAELPEFVQRYCADCHVGADAGGSVDFEQLEQSATRQTRRDTWETVVRVLESGTMPPDDAEQPADEIKLRIVQGLKQYYEHYDATAPPVPGRVTMRRLNRVEYRNTIRDLMGIDFDPTADFPSDDIGHGFDNIGDVLTLSPLLMERYVAAAESIVERAIVPNPPEPPARHVASRFTEPAAQEIPMDGDFRVMSVNGTDPLQTGPLHVPFEFREDGEYKFRVRLYRQPSDRPLSVAVMLWGGSEEGASSDGELSQIVGEPRRPCRILKIVEIQATDSDDAQTIDVDVPTIPGRERMSLGIVKSEGNEEAKVYVKWFWLQGPLDTRPASHRLLLEAPSEMSDADKTRFVLGRFLRRAYRRPATADEVERLTGLVAAEVAAGVKWEQAMQLAMQAVLCSPKFLFRVELDSTPEDAAVEMLDEFQLASRLSYFLWSSMPDEQLLGLADRGELTANLGAQVDRMLADPKSSALIENFAPQWLQIQRLSAFQPNPEQFPSFDDRLKRAMARETTLFFEAIVRENRSILELVDADFTYLNEPLARLYGIRDTKGNREGQDERVDGGERIRGREFVRVELQDGQRGGVLTHASVLAVTSNPTRTSPVKRGRWVLEQILGEPPPPPPPNVPDLESGDAAVVSGSLRERMEAHRANPACANCHAKMDAIGFALENFDPIGAFRTADGEFEIDASGEFPDGATFTGIEDLKTILLERRDEFTRCLAEKMMIYALGRGLEYYDRAAVREIESAVAADGYKMQTLIREIVMSPPFRSRGGLPTEP